MCRARPPERHSVTNFTSLGLAAPLLTALEGEGYTTPTPIQARAIPHVLAGKDLLGIAQTGTGKTAAFALPILHRLAENRRPAPRKGCRVLVLSPTRELATQIGESFRTYGRHLGVSVAVVFGGVGHRPQIDAMAKGVDVLVATPGRLLDHMGTRTISVEGTEIFVLDEADQMLDLGFVKPIRQIVARLSVRRQSLFFSATMPKEIAGLAAELLREPEKVSVTPAATTVERIEQRVIHVPHSRKRAVLTEILADTAVERALVFTRTKRGADRVAAHLEAAGITVAAIHGNKSQGQREKALGQFRASRVKVLVATDIAARGLDIDHVSHVVNFELPEVAEAYVHRIGRTARAGAEGKAISLCDPEERDLLRAIERLARISIPVQPRAFDPLETVDQAAEGASDRAERGAGRYEGRRGRGLTGGQGRGGARNAGRVQSRAGESRPSENRPSEMRAGERAAERSTGTPGEGRFERGGEGRRERGPAGSEHGRARDGRRPDSPERSERQTEANGARAPRTDRHRDERGPRSPTRQMERDGADRRPAAAPSGRSRPDDGDLARVAFLAPTRRDGAGAGRPRQRSAGRAERR
jgi:ATP-dependent RNA helicase RhlE